MKKVVVLIPVYKSILGVDEEVSFRQTLTILGKHVISLVCPESLDVEAYGSIANECEIKLEIQRFSNVFFNGIAGYNKLLLSEIFYSRFKNYDYMLICQLDAFVFKDDLLEWCAKGYDYIGAPLFGDYFDVNQGIVGNGGFCLRRVEAFRAFFEGRKNVYKTGDILNHLSSKKKPFLRKILRILMLLGLRNKPKSVANHWRENEDLFWSIKLDGTNYALQKPSVLEALHFSFERFPSEAYHLISCLPFGCHAWKKYHYDEFWSKFIHEQEY